MKKIFNKSDRDFQQLLRKKQFQRDVHCAKNIWMTFRYFYIFLYETVSFIFAMGLILVPLSVFWKKTSLSKVMEISNNYYATISFRGMNYHVIIIFYFFFIFSCYIKPKSISERFKAIFVKQFLPWKPTPFKPSSTL